MSKVFLDVNVIIDILTDRGQFSEKYSEYIKGFGYQNIFISSLSIHIIYYLLKVKPNTEMAEKIFKLINLVNLSSLSYDTITKAIEIGYKDFEDCLQYISAIESGCDTLITRDKKDFKAIQNIVKNNIEIVTL